MANHPNRNKPHAMTGHTPGLEIVSSLERAVGCLDAIDGQPIGQLGKRLDETQKHVLAALREAQDMEDPRKALDNLLAATQHFLFELDRKADREDMEDAVKALRIEADAARAAVEKATTP
jgi:hypothetical protein